MHSTEATLGPFSFFEPTYRLTCVLVPEDPFPFPFPVPLPPLGTTHPVQAVNGLVALPLLGNLVEEILGGARVFVGLVKSGIVVKFVVDLSSICRRRPGRGGSAALVASYLSAKRTRVAGAFVL